MFPLFELCMLELLSESISSQNTVKNILVTFKQKLLEVKIVCGWVAVYPFTFLLCKQNNFCWYTQSIFSCISELLSEIIHITDTVQLDKEPDTRQFGDLEENEVILSC